MLSREIRSTLERETKLKNTKLVELKKKKKQKTKKQKQKQIQIQIQKLGDVEIFLGFGCLNRF